MRNLHNFHIPVMGIGYTIDTPLKVAHLGIDSVISLVDDMLIEKIRKFYCEKEGIQYEEITPNHEDYRASRITSYLNMINDLVKEKFQELKNTSNGFKNELIDYFEMLPNYSDIRNEFDNLVKNGINFKEIGKFLTDKLQIGSISVNIMTKADKENYIDKEKLSYEYNDAHSALRGFANSDLNSSIVFSSGMNPSLFNYLPNFEDFYPNQKGDFKKTIILKVSDFRSASIQGKYLAKKGIWVSEFRIESGLNCGGHAFPTDGLLIGPILDEFKNNINDLTNDMFKILTKALTNQNRIVPEKMPNLRITAQGGVGTNEEHNFLLEHYNLDSVGWGTPFLLVPEVVNVDAHTLQQLIDSKEDDLYLSNISPLGVQFNSLKGNTKDKEKEEYIKQNRPGSPCPKRYVSLNKEFGDYGICTASREYQYLKIKELENMNLPQLDFQAQYSKIVEKSCICVGLGTSALLVNGLDTKVEGDGVSVCPGPNMAYYNKELSLKEMVDHIYGRSNVIERQDRPNIFIKELSLYFNYLKNQVQEKKQPISNQNNNQLEKFGKNLQSGIDYYKNLFSDLTEYFANTKAEILNELNEKSLLISALLEDLQTER